MHTNNAMIGLFYFIGVDNKPFSFYSYLYIIHLYSAGNNINFYGRNIELYEKILNPAIRRLVFLRVCRFYCSCLVLVFRSDSYTSLT